MFVCFSRHNGWRNCPSFSLRYLICFVTKVTWELIIWHIIFLQVSFWKIGFWQICHFVNRLFDIFVIWWVGHLLSLLFIGLVIPITGYHLLDLEPGVCRKEPACPSPWDLTVHVFHTSGSVAWNWPWWECLDHRNLQTLQIRALFFLENQFTKTPFPRAHQFLIVNQLKF